MINRYSKQYLRSILSNTNIFRFFKLNNIYLKKNIDYFKTSWLHNLKQTSALSNHLLLFDNARIHREIHLSSWKIYSIYVYYWPGSIARNRLQHAFCRPENLTIDLVPYADLPIRHVPYFSEWWHNSNHHALYKKNSVTINRVSRLSIRSAPFGRKWRCLHNNFVFYLPVFCRVLLKRGTENGTERKTEWNGNYKMRYS